MAKTNYIERVNSFIVPYLAKNGYELIRTEFVTEDNNNYLRLYIDLAAEELAKREAKAAALRGDSEEDKTASEAEADMRAADCDADITEDSAAEQTDTAQISADKAQTAADTEQTAAADNSADTAEVTDAAAEDGEEPVAPGVSINDCVKVSRYLSKWLDKEDFIKEMYTMEVCSRGFLNEAVTSEV